MATELIPQFTLEQYLALERQAEDRSEYYHGHVYRRPGSTEPHARLSARMGFLLQHHLKGRCRVYGSDLEIYLEKQDASILTP